MAYSGTVYVPSKTWFQLTKNDATKFRAQSQGVYGIHLMPGLADTPPTDKGGSVELAAMGMLPANLTLADLWPHDPAIVRVWAWTDGPQTVPVSVSHD